MAEPTHKTTTATTLAEYEDRFKDIDSELDAIRSSMATVDDKEDDGKGGGSEDNADDNNHDTSNVVDLSVIQTNLAEQSAQEMQDIVKNSMQKVDAGAQQGHEDNNMNDTSTSEALDIAATRVSLAEQTAAEMEDIVKKTLRENPGTQSDSRPASEAKQPSQEHQNQNKSPGLKKRRTKQSRRRRLLLITIIAVVLVAVLLLAWKFFLSPSAAPNSYHSLSDPHVAVHNQQQRQSERQQEIVRKRQRCRYGTSGEEYCESDEQQESRTLLSGGSAMADAADAVSTAGNPGHQEESHYRARQVCRTVNGQKHCESDEQHARISSNDGSTAASQGQTSNQGYYYRRQVCRTVNGQKYCESYEEEESSSRTA
jgi:cell division protein FtsL